MESRQPRHPVPTPRNEAPGATSDAAAKVPINYGPGVRFARGVLGGEQRRRYEQHYRKALAGKAGGDPEVAGILAGRAYRREERAARRG